MHIARTAHEVIIDAPRHELAALGERIGSLKDGQSLSLAAEAKDLQATHEQGSSLVVVESDRTFLAVWSGSGTLRIEGRSAILQDFAACFSFSSESPPGSHSHWDLGSWSEQVAGESLPLVVRLA